MTLLTQREQNCGNVLFSTSDRLMFIYDKFLTENLLWIELKLTGLVLKHDKSVLNHSSNLCIDETKIFLVVDNKTETNWSLDCTSLDLI